MTDIFLVIASAIGVVFTPKGKYKRLTWWLLVEFLVFVGFSFLVAGLGLTDGIWFDAITALGSFAFVLIFLLAKGHYLAVISGLIALYHTSAIWIGNDYHYPIMLSFCLLQLAYLVPWLRDGYKRYKFRNVPDNSRHSSRHYYSH